MGYLNDHADEECVGEMIDGVHVKRKPTPAEIEQELADELNPEEIAIKSWQQEMDTHDAKWTLRMAEDQVNLMLGSVTLQELRDAANVDQIPLEWWVEEKARIRASKP